MLPSSPATPAVSSIGVTRARARRQIRMAAVAPSRPYAAMPARRALSAHTFAARRSGGQAANRSTSRTRNESRHATAYAAAIRRAAPSSPRASASDIASRTANGRARVSSTSADSGSRMAMNRRESDGPD